MAERDAQRAQEVREKLRGVVGFSAADEIEKLDRLKKAGLISDAEFARLRAKLVGTMKAKTSPCAVQIRPSHTKLLMMMRMMTACSNSYPLIRTPSPSD